MSDTSEKFCPVMENPEADCRYFKRCKANWRKTGGAILKTYCAYPEGDYQTPIEKAFRELPANREKVCPYVHETLVASGYVPAKPDWSVMYHAVENHRGLPREDGVSEIVLV